MLWLFSTQTQPKLNKSINKDKDLSAWGISKKTFLKAHSYLFELKSRKSFKQTTKQLKKLKKRFKVNTRLVTELELLELMNYKKETGKA